MERQRLPPPAGAARTSLVFLGSVSGFVWMFTAVDDILYHTPYFWGRWCGEAGLPTVARYGCKAVYDYYFSLDAHMIDSGVIAAVFLAFSSACIMLLWVPQLGALRALVRVWLVVVPLEVFTFEAGVYFLLNYWWTVHATQFLTGTPLSNEVVFWGAAALLTVGVSVEVVLGRSRGQLMVTSR